MNFNKNDLMDQVNSRFFDSFCITLDVANYVPEDYLDEVDKYIFKNLKKAWKRIEKEDKKYQKSLLREECEQKKKAAAAQKKEREQKKKAAAAQKKELERKKKTVRAKELKRHNSQAANNLEVSNEQQE